MNVLFDLDKIRYGSERASFVRAVDLYNKGKVTQVEDRLGGITAVVLGTEPYNVSISIRNFKQGGCTCYLGQKGTICKHMIALAIYAVMDGKPLDPKKHELSTEVKCSGRLGQSNDMELIEINMLISAAMKYIKAYNGPSKTWFRNQDSLREGCARLTEIVNRMPVNRQTSDILVKLLLRLDKKLSTGGVDDSNGIVGGFMKEVTDILVKFAKLDKECILSFKKIVGIETGFGWEEPLIKLFEK